MKVPNFEEIEFKKIFKFVASMGFSLGLFCVWLGFTVLSLDSNMTTNQWMGISLMLAGACFVVHRIGVAMANDFS